MAAQLGVVWEWRKRRTRARAGGRRSRESGALVSGRGWMVCLGALVEQQRERQAGRQAYADGQGPARYTEYPALGTRVLLRYEAPTAAAAGWQELRQREHANQPSPAQPASNITLTAHDGPRCVGSSRAQAGLRLRRREVADADWGEGPARCGFAMQASARSGCASRRARSMSSSGMYGVPCVVCSHVGMAWGQSGQGHGHGRGRGHGHGVWQGKGKARQGKARHGMAWHGMAIAWPGPRAWVPGEGKEGMATGQDGRRQDETRQDETRCREGSSFQPTYHLPSLPSIPFPWFPAGAPREPVRARPAPRERATSGRAGGWRLANCACIGCSAQVIQCGRNLKRANCLYLPSSLAHLANHRRRRVPHHSVMEAQPDGSQKKKSPWMAAVAERNWAGQARQGSCGQTRLPREARTERESPGKSSFETR